MSGSSASPSAESKELFRSDRYADIFNPEDASNPFAEIYAEKLRYVLAQLREERGAIVDLGGGPGRFSTALAAERERALVVHLDLSGEMVRRARERARSLSSAPPRIGYGVSDAEHPPLRAGCIDTILALDLLCHLPRPEVFLEGVHRALRSGGRLVVDNSNARAWWMFAYPGYLHPRWHWRAFWRTFLAGGVPPRWQGRVHHYRRGRFQRLVRAAGFEIETRRDFGPGPCPKWHLLVVRKPAGT